MYKYHKTYFSTRIETIEQPKKNMEIINILTIVIKLYISIFYFINDIILAYLDHYIILFTCVLTI